MNGGRGRVVTRAAVATVACAVGASLVACTAPTAVPSPSPSVVTSSRPTTTPSPTPTPTADAAIKPERPAAMDEANAAGAEAAAVYFLQLYPYVYATGDLAEWRELSHPECIFCASVISNVEEQIAAGEHSVGGLISVSTVSSIEVDTARWFSVSVDLTQEPSQRVDLSGTPVEDFPESKAYHMEIALVREGDQLRIRELSHTRTD